MSGRLARVGIIFISGLAVWDAWTFAFEPSAFSGAAWLFLKVGTFAAIALAIAGAAISWVWPASRPGQLLGWCMSLAAFTWISFTLAPLSPELPYRRFLASLGVTGEFVAFANRTSLFFLMVALARFAVLFPSPLKPSQLRSGWQAWQALSSEGTRVAGRMVALFQKPIKLQGMRGYSHLPRWLVTERWEGRSPAGSQLLWRWVIERPVQVWAGAVLVSFLVAPGLLLGSETLTGAALLVEFMVLFLLVTVFGWGIRLQYALAGAADRQRLLWIVEGAAVAMLCYFLWSVVVLTNKLGLRAFEEILPFGMPFTTRVYVAISFLVSPGMFTLLCALAGAAFYRGAVDPRLAIRRTTLYGTLGVGFLFLFAGLENAVQGFFESSLGLAPLTGSVITGGTIAVVLIPVKRRLDRYITRILPATTLAEGPTREIAILFSDIAGFTALTGSDQRTGLTVMSVFHKAADRIAREHRGRFVKAVADEVILEFNDCSDAIRAGRELQGEFHEAARKLNLPTPAISTGIHFGSATRSPDGDIFGDAVNIASRVQSLAKAGEIVLTAAVCAGLDAHEFALESMGLVSLKNVEARVECSRLVGAASPPSVLR